MLTRIQMQPRARLKTDITTARTAKLLIADDDPTNARILSLINDLSNSVLAKRRAAEIHKYVELSNSFMSS